MKLQWNVIFGLIFALLVALFAVFNVNQVEVDYLFGTAQMPLILVIIGSALLGGLMVGSFGIVRQYRLQWKIKKLTQELDKANEALQAVSVENTVPQQTTETPAEDAEQSQSQSHSQSQSEEADGPATAAAVTQSTSSSSEESSDNRDCEESQVSPFETTQESPEQKPDPSSSSLSQNSDKS